MRPNRSSNARLSSPAVLHQAWLCGNRKDSRLSGRAPRDHDDKTFDQTEAADVISFGAFAVTSPLLRVAPPLKWRGFRFYLLSGAFGGTVAGPVWATGLGLSTPVAVRISLPSHQENNSPLSVFP